MRPLVIITALVSSAWLFSCVHEPVHPEVNTIEGFQIPEGFPPIQYPADNEYSPDRAALGKKLFYEPLMSRDSSVSCQSCHSQELAFTDGEKRSFGIENRQGTRNAPSLANVAYHPYFTREGGVPTLEMQVLVPIQEKHEFDFNILRIAERLREDPLYNELSQKAYGRDMDYYVITRALANFERTLISGNSAYDQYKHQGNSGAMSEKAIAGMKLFNSEKTNCSSCHGGFDFTNYSFQNNGLAEKYEDEGRFRLTRDEQDRAKFKVPSLRNVEVTAPYMHNGSLESLEEVVEHYNQGGKGHPNQSDFIKPLGLSEEEKANLVSFLKALTDREFLNDQRFGQE